MHATLAYLLKSIRQSANTIRKVLAAHDLLDWEESKELFAAYQALENRLETVGG